MSPPADFSITSRVPGLGQPLDYVPTKTDPLYVGKPLPTALLDTNYETRLSTSRKASRGPTKFFLTITAVREYFMLQFMDLITDKPDWHEKVFDFTITENWRSEKDRAAVAIHEALRADWKVNKSTIISDTMFDHCIAELQHIAKNVFAKRDNGAVLVYNGNVVKSDKAVTKALKSALQEAVKPLEMVPANEQDWHPGSDRMVLDLVHPSLFPLIYGKSKVLKVGEKVVGLDDCIDRIGEGEVLELEDDEPEGNTDDEQPYSLEYQWLPCEVDISGDKAKIISYINNLLPKEHAKLYGIIEQVVDAAIPLWELTLAPLYAPTFQHFQRIDIDTIEYKYDHQYVFYKDLKEEGDEGTHDSDSSEGFVIRTVVQPEPGQFDARKLNMAKRVYFKARYGKLGRPLQIIVKLANIELTPDKPTYNGGAWHVEGKQNEHICAIALYYYDSHNITPSHLAFKQFVNPSKIPKDLPEGYDESREFLEQIFGCKHGVADTQTVAQVETREGRLLTFPNILQHQVQPFKLEDPTRKGHRKILALFLVDPNVRIMSTANVPPQRLDWWREAILSSTDSRRDISGSGPRRLNELPVEIEDQVFGAVDGFPISMDEAKEIRLKLMEERASFANQHESWVRDHGFSLCEH